MSYAPPVGERLNLVSRTRLERAMKDRDVNASELAALADTTRQTISRLRRGIRNSAELGTARNIERALRVPTGHLFISDDQP